ncbi:MAG: AmmeMemoRadiSam system protein B [Candidatus Brocadiales bacterium]|nr:AmmeMemoRadiSam system protein B [Candidatus Bathyanammoxibius amoris]
MNKLAAILVAVLLALSSPLFAQTAEEETETFGPRVSGFFYPRSVENLQKIIALKLGKVIKQELPGRPIALISPHAGYDFSGEVAAYGFSALEGGDYKRVIILAPSHYGKRFRGVAVLKASRYKTPLGEIEIDKEVCEGLVNNSPKFDSKPLFGYYSGAYMNEHALETQLPFLQEVLGKFKLVPLLVGVLMDDDTKKVADAIKPYFDESTVVIASSDFTHYGRRFDYVPFFKEIEKNLKALDDGAVNEILEKDSGGLVNYRKETGITVCGFMPIGVLLDLLPDDAQGTVLKYDTSGRMEGDFNHSVSYVSIVFTVPTGEKTGKAPELPAQNARVVLAAYSPEGDKGAAGAMAVPAGEHSQTSDFITEEECETLLNIARSTLETYTRQQVLPDIPEEFLTPRLKEKSGVFVTLKKNGQLRGCIGHIQPRMPLWRAVMMNTANSAFKDSRFRRVSEEELKDIDIEISVLSPNRRINSPGEFHVGEEGIIISLGRRQAVFLPQVATEQGWDRNQTFYNLCNKAGLPWNAWWDENMEFYVFTTKIFHEVRH